MAGGSIGYYEAMSRLMNPKGPQLRNQARLFRGAALWGLGNGLGLRYEAQ